MFFNHPLQLTRSNELESQKIKYYIGVVSVTPTISRTKCTRKLRKNNQEMLIERNETTGKTTNSMKTDTKK